MRTTLLRTTLACAIVSGIWTHLSAGPDGGADAIATLRRAADAGDPVARRRAGMALLAAAEDETTVGEGMMYLRDAAYAGDVDAMRELASALSVAAYDDGNMSSSYRWYKKAADAGDRASKSVEAFRRLNGDGIVQDATGAQRDLDDYAARGEPNALLFEAGRLLSGADADKNAAKAIGILEDLDAAGFAPARTTLAQLLFAGQHVTADPKRAERLWELAADAGDVRAMTNLAWFRASKGDASGALALYRKAATLGGKDAAGELGIMLLSGAGGSRKPEEAVVLLAQAASKKYTRAMSALAYCYLSGDGVPKNPRLAAKLARDAADAGDGYANELLAGMLVRGDGVEKDMVEGEARFMVAARLGLKNAAAWLAERQKAGALDPQSVSTAKAIVVGIPGAEINFTGTKRKPDDGMPAQETGTETPAK